MTQMAEDFPDDRCLIIGEVAQAHMGSLRLAHAFVDAIANAGADAVKFQTFIAAAQGTSSEPQGAPFSPQDGSPYEYGRRTEFSEEQWRGLRQHAQERGLLFLSSPYSVEAVDLLARVGVAAWKVGSSEVADLPMFGRMATSRLPILLSTGTSPLAEIDAAVVMIRSYELPLVILQSTSIYPCPAEKVGLNLIPFFRRRYASAVGLSDRTGTIYPGIAAVALGIAVLEVQVTLSREVIGLDTDAALTTMELTRLVEGVRFVERTLASPVDKDVKERELLSS